MGNLPMTQNEARVNASVKTAKDYQKSVASGQNSSFIRDCKSDLKFRKDNYNYQMTPIIDQLKKDQQTIQTLKTQYLNTHSQTLTTQSDITNVISQIDQKESQSFQSGLLFEQTKIEVGKLENECDALEIKIAEQQNNLDDCVLNQGFVTRDQEIIIGASAAAITSFITLLLIR